MRWLSKEFLALHLNVKVFIPRNIKSWIGATRVYFLERARFTTDNYESCRDFVTQLQGSHSPDKRHFIDSDEDRDIGLRKWRLDGVGKEQTESRAKLHPSYLSIRCQMNSRRNPIDRLIFSRWIPPLPTRLTILLRISNVTKRDSTDRLTCSVHMVFFNLCNGATSITMMWSAQTYAINVYVANG